MPGPDYSARSGDVVCFGELLLRLTAPGRELLLQSGKFDVHVGGAEANVAVGLSRLGRRTAMISKVPDNPLGEAAAGYLRSHGVSVEGVQRAPGRMGLYFLSSGAGHRPSSIVYDREGSSFATAGPDDFDWANLLDGAALLHLSGITPALGPRSAEAAIDCAEAARSRGIPISFDGNYRAKLWQRWNSDAKTALGELAARSDILLGNHRDISLLLSQEFDGDGEERRREAAEAAFAAYPNVRIIASTVRHLDHSDRHRIAARMDSPDGAYQTEEIALGGVVDRIGTGDAFAAGVLHGLLNGADHERALHYGLALACLKHSLPGDASLFTQADIDAFLSGELDVRR
jgi:2-dehydro-3-deoxygluconokinase